MKKTLLFVLATLFAYAMNAQTLFSEDFESGSLSQWTVVDNDNDGYEWEDYFGEGYGHNESSCVSSASYINSVGALNPDNWLITAQPIAIPATGYALSWYVAAMDANYYAEHYSVYVSTSNEVSAMSSATPVYQATLTSADWVQNMVSLDAYAGQSVYIAFRHHNVTDMYWMHLDDISVAFVSTTPEIALAAIDVPVHVDVNSGFNVKGTVTNLSSTALTSYEVTYTINGVTSAAYTVSGINVAMGGTHNFTHNVPAVVTTAGETTITVTVANPNGVADNTADNSISQAAIACGPVTEFPYNEGFEDGVLASCWNSVSLSGNGEWSDGYEYINYYGADYYFEANSGVNAAMSSGSAGDMNFLVSPAFTLPADAPAIGFKYYDYFANPTNQGYESTAYQVMISTTDNNPSSFQTLGDMITLTDHVYTQRVIDLTAYAGQTIYIAFLHTYDAWMMIDDISVEIAETTPEIALNSISVPSLAYVGEQFEVSGVITNNSASTLNTFKAQYSVGGTASQVETITISGGLAFGETYEFTCSAPATTTQEGDIVVTLTVSEPNGTPDNTADNSLTDTVASILCQDITEFPYDENFDEGYGLASSCWKSASTSDGGWTNAYAYIYNYGTQYPFAANSGINSVLSLGESGENWLVSPAIVLPANATEISFSYYDYLSVDFNEIGSAAYSVLLSTTGNAMADFTHTAYEGTVDENDFTQRTVDLTQYKGQTIYLAFVHSADAWMIIDDVNITVNTGSNPGQGINDVNAASVKLYPNPTTGNLYVDVEGLQKVEIIDAVGRVVMSQNNGTVNMSNLANGIYTVRVSANGTTTIKKVVKK